MCLLECWKPKTRRRPDIKMQLFFETKYRIRRKKKKGIKGLLSYFIMRWSCVYSRLNVLFFHSRCVCITIFFVLRTLQLPICMCWCRLYVVLHIIWRMYLVGENPYTESTVKMKRNAPGTGSSTFHAVVGKDI